MELNFCTIWAAIKRETLFFTLVEGVATLKKIDRIFKVLLGASKGPFEQMDVVGLDIENHYAQVRTGLPKQSPQLLKETIARNKLGIKSLLQLL